MTDLSDLYYRESDSGPVGPAVEERRASTYGRRTYDLPPWVIVSTTLIAALETIALAVLGVLAAR